MTDVVNIHEAKTHLSKLLARVAAGERIVIAKAGEPIADLVPHSPNRVKFGTLKGRISVPDDFDDPDPEILRMFYGEDVGADAPA
ncbi:MAG: type II toxin-antitoxin system Phd/YefM family antitoxin [Sporichthyaceae bacterium]